MAQGAEKLGQIVSSMSTRQRNLAYMEAEHGASSPRLTRLHGKARTTVAETATWKDDTDHKFSKTVMMSGACDERGGGKGGDVRPGGWECPGCGLDVIGPGRVHTE